MTRFIDISILTSAEQACRPSCDPGPRCQEYGPENHIRFPTRGISVGDLDIGEHRTPISLDSLFCSLTIITDSTADLQNESVAHCLTSLKREVRRVCQRGNIRPGLALIYCRASRRIEISAKLSPPCVLINHLVRLLSTHRDIYTAAAKCERPTEMEWPGRRLIVIGQSGFWIAFQRLCWKSIPADLGR